VLWVVERREQHDLLAEPGAGGEQGCQGRRCWRTRRRASGGDDLLEDSSARAASLTGSASPCRRHEAKSSTPVAMTSRKQMNLDLLQQGAGPAAQKCALRLVSS
jgi:hypothetical protein